MEAKSKLDAINLVKSLVNKSNANHSYNYEKIAKDIFDLKEIIRGLNKFAEKDLKGVQTKISQFVDCKTKADSVEAQVKKTIRKFFQSLDTDCESTNAEKKANANNLLKLLSDYRS